MHIRITREPGPLPRPGLCAPGICSMVGNLSPTTRPWAATNGAGGHQCLWQGSPLSLLINTEDVLFSAGVPHFYPKTAQSFLHACLQTPSQISRPAGWGPGRMVGRFLAGQEAGFHSLNARYVPPCRLYVLIPVFQTALQEGYFNSPKGIWAQTG